MINININLFKGIVNEEWRPIKGFPGYYISDQGRVKSVKSDKEKILKQWLRNGYPTVDLYNNGQKTREYVHRLVGKAFLEISDDQEIDHVNGIRTDNRLKNLRVCTHAENGRNLKKRRDNTTGYPGVSYNKQSGKYRAYIYIDGKQKHLGYYDTAEEAAIAYYNESLKHHGEFSPFVSRDEFKALEEWVSTFVTRDDFNALEGRVSALERLHNLKTNISEGAF